MTWADANRIAVLAMGREYSLGGKDGRWTWKADADPLAAWCLTELIHDTTEARPLRVIAKAEGR